MASRTGIGNFGRRVANRIEHARSIRADFVHAVDQAVRVQGGIAAVGGDFVVEIFLGVAPVPFGDDDVALDALRTRRRLLSGIRLRRCGRSNRRTFASARFAAKALRVLPFICEPTCADETRRLHAATEESKWPRLAGKFARGLVAELVAGLAAVGLHHSIHWPWLLTFGEMPLPLGPVPGKSLLAGSFSSEYQ